MKIRITKEVSICVDETYGILGYLHAGDEYDLLQTDDGLKIQALGMEISPYDILDSTEIVEEDKM